MKYILMNKNKEVLIAEYDTATNVFTKIYQVKDIHYDPYILKNFNVEKDINNTPFRTNLSEWFDDLLHQYQHLTGYSDTRIHKLCILLNRQINKFKELIGN